jgi:hypothetical protein
VGAGIVRDWAVARMAASHNNVGAGLAVGAGHARDWAVARMAAYHNNVRAGIARDKGINKCDK